MQPKISVIVPVYNAERYLKKCVDSILRQTLDDIEVILVDDGSTDNSKIILKEYKMKDNRVKVIEQSNSGPSVARNNGIKLASGKYIGFVDSDDYIEKTMYEKLIYIADENNVEIAMCNYRELYCFDNTGMKSNHKLLANKVYNKQDIEKSIITTFTESENYGFYSLVNKIYNREWLLSTKICLDREREHGEDWWFNIQIFMKTENFICINEALYNYIHINQNSLMSKYRDNQFEIYLDGRKKLISIIPQQLINYRELNTRFIYEFSSYIIRTFKEVKDSKKRNALIDIVLTNEEVVESCRENLAMSLHFKLITVLIKKKLTNTAKCAYKVFSILK